MKLSKDCIVRLGAVSGLALMGCMASAQVRVSTGAPQPTGLSLRIGAFLPTSTAGSDIGSEWFTAGIDYKLNSASASSVAQMGVLPTYLSVSLDYVTKDGFSVYPLVLNYNVKMYNFVYAVGVGLQETQVSGSNRSSTTSLALQGGVTYDFVKKPIPLFLQAKYMYSNYEEFRGVGVYLGARF